ncbi:MAG TPA: hypothetical protein VI306_03170 [Pyrinomonadaceae bacterium]
MTLKATLRKYRLVRYGQRVRQNCRTWLRTIGNEELRQRRHLSNEAFVSFKQKYQTLLRRNQNGHPSSRCALVVSRRYPSIEVEVTLIKALELAGFRPVVLLMIQDKFLRRYYDLAGYDVVYWDPFGRAAEFNEAAANLLTACRTQQDVLQLEENGVRIGKNAVSTLLRQLRKGSLDLTSSNTKQKLSERLSFALGATAAAKDVLDELKPEILLSVDIEYTPEGELYDSCLRTGVDVIRFEVAHKNNSLIFKRYTFDNRDEHFSTLSNESWNQILSLGWTKEHRNELDQELYRSYITGDWYGGPGTQHNKRLVDTNELRKTLGLDPTRKNAVIFPHILWDASLRWGVDLFRDYEEWLIETVRVACANDSVNWVIKVHPAHVGKNQKERFNGEPAEIVSLRKHLGELPPHIHLITPESEISTYSLFEIMDYCVTVRGTVGIEAAMRGIPVFTAGTGRYDRRGFTIDSTSREEYLERIKTIAETARLSPQQQELAERFAYGLFLLRPFPTTTVKFEFHGNGPIAKDWSRTKAHSNLESKINISKPEEWAAATDLQIFANWINNERNPDYLKDSSLGAQASPPAG